MATKSSENPDVEDGEDLDLKTSQSHDAAFVDDAEAGASQSTAATTTAVAPSTTAPASEVSTFSTNPTFQLNFEADPASNNSSLSFDDRCNLIVNYLPQSITEERMRNMFSPFGTLESCKLMIDKHTKQSLGYGFVRYVNPDSSQKAIDSMNGKLLDGKTLKVAYARPSSSQIQNANLYVSHLEPHITKEMLDKIFAPYGNIIDSKVLYDPRTGQSKGVGFVRYDTKAQAQAAVNALNGAILPNMTQALVVKFADGTNEKMKRRQRTGGPMGAGFGGAMGGMGAVGGMGGGFHHRHADQQLNAPQLRYDPMRGAASAAAARSFAYSTPPLALFEPPVISTPTFQQQAFCLFVYHLPTDADENLLYRLFGPFGAIASVKIARDNATGQCRGFGFVNFIKLEDAQQAIINMNGYQLGTKILQVSFKTPGKKGQ